MKDTKTVDLLQVGQSQCIKVGGCRTACTRLKNLETVIESVPRPRRWLFFQLQNRRECVRFKLALTPGGAIERARGWVQMSEQKVRGGAASEQQGLGRT